MKISVNETLAATLTALALQATPLAARATNDTPKPMPQPTATATGVGTATIIDKSHVEGGKGGDVKIGEGALSPSSTSTSHATSGASTSHATGGTSTSGSNLTDNSKTNIDASNHSQYKGAAATTMPNAASQFALKACVSSTSFGAGAGSVYGVYGGVSLNHTGSGAVAVVYKGEDGKDHAITIPELSDMSPINRAAILPSADQKLIMCLTSEYQASMRRMEVGYRQALGVATIQGQVDTYRAKLAADTAIELERIRQVGELAKIGQEHYCGHNAQKGVPLTVARGDTKNRPLDDSEHGKCNKTTDAAVNFLLTPTNQPAHPPVLGVPSLTTPFAPVAAPVAPQGREPAPVTARQPVPATTVDLSAPAPGK